MNFLPGLENLKNAHPLFVHFPVALTLVTLLFEGLWWTTKKKPFRDSATHLLYLSAVFAVATVITGYLASNGLGHESPGHEFVHEHRNVMLLMRGLLLVTALAVLMSRSPREGRGRRVLIGPLLIVSALLVYGADKGGRLVLQYGIGVQAVSEKAIMEDENHEHKLVL
ncbi:MAG: DUF2231 domain-containing protein [bacterium]